MGVLEWQVQQGKEPPTKRIRYVSELTSELSAEELDELARISDENNRRDSLTGVLVASGRVFFQLLEGPDGAVDACFERIRIAQQRNVIEDLTGVLERVMWHELIDAQPVD